MQEGLSKSLPKGHAQAVVKTGNLVINLHTKAVTINGARVHVTGKKYEILKLLSLHKGVPLTREMLLDHLYRGRNEPVIKIIEVFMCKLRKMLFNASGGKNYIETIWRRGYMLRDPRGK